jgi:hypothetical protein
MVGLTIDAPIPPSRDARLDELAGILARGLLRMAARKSGFPCENRLEVSGKTRLSVATSERPEECEVT